MLMANKNWAPVAQNVKRSLAGRVMTHSRFIYKHTMIVGSYTNILVGSCKNILVGSYTNI